MRMKNKDRQSMYDRTGMTYEVARYGDPYKDLYKQMRNSLLLDIFLEYYESTRSLRILEIGCGTGLTLDFLAKLPMRHDLHGLDYSMTMLAQAAEKASLTDNPAQFALGDSFNLPFRDECFDVVYSTRFIHQFEHDEKKAIYREMSRILNVGGLIVTEFYNRHSSWFSSIRGMRERPLAAQCPTTKEVRDVVGSVFIRRPIRMVGLRRIFTLLGFQTLKMLTKLTEFHVMSPLLEEYFVVTQKSSSPRDTTTG